MDVCVKLRSYTHRPNYFVDNRGQIYEQGKDEVAFKDSQRNGQVSTILFKNAASTAEAVSAVELVTGSIPDSCVWSVITADENGVKPDVFQDITYDLETGVTVDNRVAKRVLKPTTIGRTPLSQRVQTTASQVCTARPNPSR